MSVVVVAVVVGSSSSSRSMSVVVGECDGEGVGDDGSSLRPRLRPGDFFAAFFEVFFGFFLMFFYAENIDVFLSFWRIHNELDKCITY